MSCSLLQFLCTSCVLRDALVARRKHVLAVVTAALCIMVSRGRQTHCIHTQYKGVYCLMYGTFQLRISLCRSADLAPRTTHAISFRPSINGRWRFSWHYNASSSPMSIAPPEKYRFGKIIAKYFGGSATRAIKIYIIILCYKNWCVDIFHLNHHNIIIDL